MADLGKFLSETQLGEGQFLIKLHNFHLAFEQIQKEVQAQHYVPIAEVLSMDHVELGEIAVLTPVLKTRQQLWFVTTANLQGESYAAFKTVRVPKSSIVNVFSVEKTPVVILNTSYKDI